MSGFGGAGAVASMMCPACRIDLVMSERQGIEIDYCPKCRGVWLDRGELDKIIDKSRAFEAQPGQGPAQGQGFAQPGYAQSGYAQSGYAQPGSSKPDGRQPDGSGWGHGKRRERRESFLERLFD